jgi:hypothetical protein
MFSADITSWGSCEQEKVIEIMEIQTPNIKVDFIFIGLIFDFYKDIKK